MNTFNRHRFRIAAQCACACLILVACNDTMTPPKKSDTTVVTPSPDTLRDVVITDTQSVDVQCLDGELREDRYVIDDEATYRQLLAIKRYTTRCNDSTLPPIDFTTRTLIAMHTLTGGCCEPLYRRTVVRSDSAGVYTLRMHITQRGLCDDGVPKMHWLTIPKMLPGYAVRFEVNEAVIEKCP